jgi:hypothetical protein
MTTDLNGVAAGSYTLTVTDQKDCHRVFGPYEVEEPEEALLLDTVRFDTVQCFGGSDGHIAVDITGGAPGYDYEWLYAGQLLPFTGDSLANRPAGMYQLNVIDDNNCLRTFEIELPEPEQLTVTLSTLSDPFRVLGQSIGGTPPYSFLWSTGANTDTIEVPVSAIYTLTVTDANGCTATEEENLVEVQALEWIDEVHLFPNPAASFIELEGRLKVPGPLTLAIVDVTGKIRYEQALGQQRNFRQRIEVADWPAGAYWAMLKIMGQTIYAAPVMIIR